MTQGKQTNYYFSNFIEESNNLYIPEPLTVWKRSCSGIQGGMAQMASSCDQFLIIIIIIIYFSNSNNVNNNNNDISKCWMTFAVTVCFVFSSKHVDCHHITGQNLILIARFIAWLSLEL